MNTQFFAEKASWIWALGASVGTLAVAAILGAVLPTNAAVPVALLLPFIAASLAEPPTAAPPTRRASI